MSKSDPKDQLKELYEWYWQGKKESFEDYPRNHVLKDLFNKGESVLDVGCGDGVVAEYLQQKIGVTITGIDISQEAVKRARERGIEAKVVTAEGDFPFGDGSFDAVFWGDNIEHLIDPQSCAQEIKRVLRPGGRLILSTPNCGYWRYRLYYFLNGRLPDTEWTGLPSWRWSHIRFFNNKLLEDFLLSVGFKKIKKVIGVSNRRLDKLGLKLLPTLFGMILVVEVS